MLCYTQLIVVVVDLGAHAMTRTKLGLDEKKEEKKLSHSPSHPMTTTSPVGNGLAPCRLTSCPMLVCACLQLLPHTDD